MLRASSCNQPRGWQSWAAERGWRRSADSSISDRPRGLVSASGPLGDQVGISVQAGGLDWEKQGFICRVLQPFLPQVTPIPRTSSFLFPPPRARGGGNQAPRWALVPPEGQGTSEEPVYCPPHPSSLPASLGTKQSLLSNFKCYLRTAWPQPKAALWKLVFRCRGCKYQRHTFEGGGGGWGGGVLRRFSPLSGRGWP